MAAPHCVYADVVSEYSDDRMTYYTHYRKMAASYNECVCVSSDYSADGMTYYTCYMKMVAPHCVYADVV
jgi:hypothetical protein